MVQLCTREVELSTIQIAGLGGDFIMPVEVTKVNKSELLNLDNPRYEEIIKNNEHMQGVTMDDHGTKDKFPVHIILGASQFAKLKTEKPPIEESVGVSSMLLAQSSQADFEQLCRLDVLGLEDRSVNCDSDVLSRVQGKAHWR